MDLKMWNQGNCKPLPGDVRNLVRSGTVLTSYTQCVEELVYNSIDAGCTHVYVTIDLKDFTLKVEDDGHGLSKDSFKVVGTRYATSKCSSVADLQRIRSYGFRGETLSSLIDMSDHVQITTTVLNGHEQIQLSKFFQNGMPVEESDSSMVIANSRYEKGTIVKVLNVLRRFPVRQNRVDPVVLLEEIINSMNHICVANSNVFLVVEDSVSEKTILSVPAHNGVMKAFHRLYCAKTPGEIHYATLVGEHHNHEYLFLTSCISTDNHANKNLQIIFVNKRFMARNKIHRHLNKLISDVLGIGKNGRACDKDAAVKKKSTNVGSSKSDRYPVFVVNITCPPTLYDVAYEAGATNVTFQDWDVVLKGCEGLVLKFTAGVQSKNALVDEKAIASFQLGQPNAEGELLHSEIGKSICTRAYPRAVHSRVAVREAVSTDGIGAASCSKDLGVMFEDISELSDDGSLPKNSPPKLIVNCLSKSPRQTRLLLAGRKSEKVHLPTLKRRSKCFQPSNLAKKKCVQANRHPILIAKHLKDLPEFKGYFRTPNMPDANIPSLDQFSWSSSENEEDPIDFHQEASQGLTSSQDWITHLKSVHISNSQSFINDGTALQSCPELTPVSHGIMKVGLWQEKNKEIEDDDDKLAFTISNATIKKVVEDTRGCQNYRDQIKKDCKAVLCSTVDGIKTWEQVKKLRNDSPCSQQEQNCKLASTSQTVIAQIMDSNSVSSCSSSFQMPTAIPTNSPNWNTLNVYVEKSDEPINPDGKISVLQAERLNPPVRHNWLQKFFPYGAKQFWVPEQSKASTNLTAQSASCSEPSGAKLDQIISQCIEGDAGALTSAKWRDGQMCSENLHDCSNPTGVRPVENWGKPLNSGEISVCHFNDSQVNDLPGKRMTASSSLNFRKEDLRSLEFVRQLDAKFLVTKMSKFINGHATKLLVLFDQHAVHERVLLEQLTTSLFETGNTKRQIVNAAIQPFILNFSHTEVRIMRRYRDDFLTLGIDFVAKNPTTVEISRAPVVLLNRATTEADRLNQNRMRVLSGLVDYLIKEQLDFFRKTNGTFQTIPKVIFEILCSVACHAAIKFGDVLEEIVCKKLLCDLGNCMTPFQCAHGRPVLFPLMDLQEPQTVANSVNSTTIDTLRGVADNQGPIQQENSRMPIDDPFGDFSQYFVEYQTSPYFPHM